MSLALPDAAAMRVLAAECGLDLDAEELELYRALLGGMLSSASALDALEPEARGEAGPREDRRWSEPAPDANRWGAWFVRSEIRRRDTGPLADMRVAIKDNVLVKGLPMLNGSPVFEGYVAEADATVVTRLLDAGATIAGKAHCEDLCLSGGSHTNVRGPVHNPRRYGHTSGGSSSGSAALVAAGEVEGAIGGDQGGSIRVPAALCGVVGLKPTWGLVPYTGIAPIEPTIDHTGPITANVRDNARMLSVLAGPDGIDMRQSGVAAEDYSEGLERGVEGVRIGVLREGFTVPGMQTEVAASVRAAAGRLAGLGAHVEDVSVPAHAQANAWSFPLLMQGMYRTVFRDGGQGSGRTDLYLPELIEQVSRWREHANRFSPLVKMVALAGAWVEREAGSHYYAIAANQARVTRADYDRALESVDLLLMPTTPMVAPPLPAPDAPILERVARSSELTPNTLPFDVTHHPAISVPCGAVDGLPVGMMLVARHWQESLLYRVAHGFEASGGGEAAR